MEGDALLWDLLKKAEFLAKKMMEQFGGRRRRGYLGLECGEEAGG